jgi:SPASM domain peptide maturase of grasp-with-spasm system
MNNEYFRLYANCIPVRGYTRSTICDVQRGRLQFIPNDLFDILVKEAAKPIAEIIQIFGEENRETIEEYFDFLNKEEYIFYCGAGDLRLFPDLDLSWDHPSVITNAIVDVGTESSHDFAGIISQLEGLGCKDIQFRFFRETSIGELSGLATLFRASSIKSIELFVPYSDHFAEDMIVQLVESEMRIHSLVFHSTPFAKQILTKNKTSIRFVGQMITDETHCGFISEGYFTINLPTFTEAQKYNSCLNRKISIDRNGEIKNCPSMRNSYGNIRDTDMGSMLRNSPSFKEFWLINKDQVEVCKDCEFRFICTDCRAYTEKNDRFSKPAKCAYDPYSAQWH